MLNEKVKCLECGKEFKRIDFHIKSHNLSSEEYRRKYGANAPLICDKILKDMSEKYISPRSLQYYINKGFSLDEAVQKISKLQSNRHKTYLRKMKKLGFSEKEAQAIISKNNSRSEKFFIDKYGEVEGKQRYKEFIQKTTSFFKNIRCSKIATELFDELKNEFKDLNFRYAQNEVKITGSNGRNYYIDCVIDDSKKFVCIEFNGDFWHANPKKYQSDEIIARGIIAREIWEKDENKSEAILEHFDDLKVVWESEINLNELKEYIKGEFYENQH